MPHILREARSKANQKSHIKEQNRGGGFVPYL